jgi:hypothetical protein
MKLAIMLILLAATFVTSMCINCSDSLGPIDDGIIIF